MAAIRPTAVRDSRQGAITAPDVPDALVTRST
jgi:hypothetical protein